MKRVTIKLEFMLLAVSAPGLLEAVQLQPDTVKAWGDYVRNADSSMQSRLDGQRPFLWTDEAPDRRASLARGEVVIAPVAETGSHSVSGGLVHDWLGAVFIPNATIGDLLAVVHDYDRYKEFYKPAVADSKMLVCTQTGQRFSMVWQRRVLSISAAIQGEYEARDFAVDGRRGYNIASTTEVREIGNYGRNTAYLMPPGEGNGFIWRLHSIARYEERDGGVYFELEAIALTRNIPLALRWLVTPVVNHLSVNSLATSLRETRDAVNRKTGGANGLLNAQIARHNAGTN
jgi:hypothetical protein